MKKFAIVLLCVFLAAAIVFGYVYYRRQLDSRAHLQVTQEQASDLDQKVTELNQEISSLNDRVESLSSELAEKNKALEAFHSEFSTKDTLVQSLRDQLAMSQKETVQLKSDYDTLISELREEKTMAENRIGQLQEKYENLLADPYELQMTQKRVAELEESVRLLKRALNEERSSKEAIENDLAGLRKQLQDNQSWVNSLEKDLAEEKKAKEAYENEQNGLLKQLEDSRSWADSLEEELGKDKTKIEWLQQQHERLALEKSSVENKLGEVEGTYNELVTDLKRQIQNQEVTIKTFQEKISVSFVDRILFKTGKATITPAGRKVLQKVGKTLKNVKGKKILVVGHTDDVPITEKTRYQYPSNWELSAARAARVVRFFQDEAGLDPKILEAVGRSYYDPVAGNETAEGRAQNRRVNIIIAPSF